MAVQPGSAELNHARPVPIMSAMAKPLVDRLVPNELWGAGGAAAAATAPARPPSVVPDRNCFAALVFTARTSTPWELLPATELGCGSPSTAWRRLDEWERAGVFDQLSLLLLDRLGETGRIDLAASASTRSTCALKGAHTAQPCRPAASVAASCT